MADGFQFLDLPEEPKAPKKNDAAWKSAVRGAGLEFSRLVSPYSSKWAKAIRKEVLSTTGKGDSSFHDTLESSLGGMITDAGAWSAAAGTVAAFGLAPEIALPVTALIYSAAVSAPDLKEKDGPKKAIEDFGLNMVTLGAAHKFAQAPKLINKVSRMAALGAGSAAVENKIQGQPQDGQGIATSALVGAATGLLPGSRPIAKETPTEEPKTTINPDAGEAPGSDYDKLTKLLDLPGESETPQSQAPQSQAPEVPAQAPPVESAPAQVPAPEPTSPPASEPTPVPPSQPEEESQAPLPAPVKTAPPSPGGIPEEPLEELPALRPSFDQTAPAETQAQNQVPVSSEEDTAFPSLQGAPEPEDEPLENPVGSPRNFIGSWDKPINPDKHNVKGLDHSFFKTYAKLHNDAKASDASLFNKVKYLGQDLVNYATKSGQWNQHEVNDAYDRLVNQFKNVKKHIEDSTDEKDPARAKLLAALKDLDLKAHGDETKPGFLFSPKDYTYPRVNPLKGNKKNVITQARDVLNSHLRPEEKQRAMDYLFSKAESPVDKAILRTSNVALGAGRNLFDLIPSSLDRLGETKGQDSGGSFTENNWNYKKNIPSIAQHILEGDNSPEHLTKALDPLVQDANKVMNHLAQMQDHPGSGDAANEFAGESAGQLAQKGWGLYHQLKFAASLHNVRFGNTKIYSTLKSASREMLHKINSNYIPYKINRSTKEILPQDQMSKHDLEKLEAGNFDGLEALTDTKDFQLKRIVELAKQGDLFGSAKDMLAFLKEERDSSLTLPPQMLTSLLDAYKYAPYPLNILFRDLKTRQEKLNHEYFAGGRSHVQVVEGPDEKVLGSLEDISKAIEEHPELEDALGDYINVLLGKKSPYLKSGQALNEVDQILWGQGTTQEKIAKLKTLEERDNPQVPEVHGSNFQVGQRIWDETKKPNVLNYMASKRFQHPAVEKYLDSLSTDSTKDLPELHTFESSRKANYQDLLLKMLNNKEQLRIFRHGLDARGNPTLQAGDLHSGPSWKINIPKTLQKFAPLVDAYNKEPFSEKKLDILEKIHDGLQAEMDKGNVPEWKYKNLAFMADQVNERASEIRAYKVRPILNLPDSLPEHVKENMTQLGQAVALEDKDKARILARKLLPEFEKDPKVKRLLELMASPEKKKKILMIHVASRISPERENEFLDHLERHLEANPDTDKIYYFGNKGTKGKGEKDNSFGHRIFKSTNGKATWIDTYKNAEGKRLMEEISHMADTKFVVGQGDAFADAWNNAQWHGGKVIGYEDGTPGAIKNYSLKSEKTDATRASKVYVHLGENLLHKLAEANNTNYAEHYQFGPMEDMFEHFKEAIDNQEHSRALSIGKDLLKQIDNFSGQLDRKWESSLYNSRSNSGTLIRKPEAELQEIPDEFGYPIDQDMTEFRRQLDTLKERISKAMGELSLGKFHKELSKLHGEKFDALKEDLSNANFRGAQARIKVLSKSTLTPDEKIALRALGSKVYPRSESFGFLGADKIEDFLKDVWYRIQKIFARRKLASANSTEAISSQLQKLYSLHSLDLPNFQVPKEIVEDPEGYSKKWVNGMVRNSIGAFDPLSTGDPWAIKTTKDFFNYQHYQTLIAQEAIDLLRKLPQGVATKIGHANRIEFERSLGIQRKDTEGYVTLTPAEKSIADFLQNQIKSVMRQRLLLGAIPKNFQMSDVIDPLMMMPEAKGFWAKWLNPERPKMGHPLKQDYKSSRIQVAQSLSKSLGKPISLLENISTWPDVIRRLQDDTLKIALNQELTKFSQSLVIGTDPLGVAEHQYLDNLKGRGSWDLRFDPQGNPVWGTQPTKILKVWEKPLDFIFNKPSPENWYKVGLRAKTITSSFIMLSPLIHLNTVFGKASMAAPGLMFTGKFFFKGRDIWNNPEMKREMVQEAGLRPAVMQYNMSGAIETEDPSFHIADDEENTPRGDVKRTYNEFFRDIYKGAKDIHHTLHGKFLATTITYIQSALYDKYKTQFSRAFLKMGADPVKARVLGMKLAARMANIYGGVIPNEHVAPWFKKSLNLALFSRSFSGTNIQILKDIIEGMPKDIQAEVLDALGPEGMKDANSLVRKTQFATFLRDMAFGLAAYNGLQIAALGYNQAPGNTPMEKIGNFLEHGDDIIKNILAGDMANAKASLEDGKVFQAFLELFPTGNNPPGKEFRADLGPLFENQDVYARLPWARLFEEYSLMGTDTPEWLLRKLGSLPKLGVHYIFGNSGGPPIYGADDPLGEKARKVGDYILQNTTDYPMIQVAKDLVPGGDKNMLGWDTSSAGLSLLGMNISKENPGLATAGYYTKEQEDALGAHKQEINRLIDSNHFDQAIDIMNKQLHLPVAEIKGIIRARVGGVSAAKVKKLYPQMSPDEQGRLMKNIGAPVNSKELETTGVPRTQGMPSEVKPPITVHTEDASRVTAAGGAMKKANEESRSLQVVFSAPGVDIAKVDNQYLQKAKKSVDIAMYSFTKSSGMMPIINTLKSLAAKGVKIRIIRDASQSAKGYDAGEALAGIPNITIKDWPGSEDPSHQFHIKMFCIDNVICRDGSANWSGIGENTASQAFGPINDAVYSNRMDFVQPMVNTFNQLWEKTH